MGVSMTPLAPIVPIPLPILRALLRATARRDPARNATSLDRLHVTISDHIATATATDGRWLLRVSWRTDAAPSEAQYRRDIVERHIRTFGWAPLEPIIDAPDYPDVSALLETVTSGTAVVRLQPRYLRLLGSAVEDLSAGAPPKPLVSLVVRPASATLGPIRVDAENARVLGVEVVAVFAVLMPVRAP